MTSEISLIPFKFSPQLLDLYYEWFNDFRNQDILYKQTPKTKEEIKAWMVDTEKNPNSRYFFLKQNNKFLGHIGLRDISWEVKAAEIGSFVPGQSIWRLSQGIEVAETLFRKAKDFGLKILLADFEETPSPLWTLLKKIGFQPSPGQENLLTFSLQLP